MGIRGSNDIGNRDGIIRLAKKKEDNYASMLKFIISIQLRDHLVVC